MNSPVIGYLAVPLSGLAEVSADASPCSYMDPRLFSAIARPRSAAAAKSNENARSNKSLSPVR